MANRNFASGGKLYSMHVMPVFIDCSITIGASGAVSSFVGSMVQSISRQSAGIYKITAQANTNFSKLYFAAGSAQSPVSGLSGILAIEIQNAPNASIATLSAMELTVKCLDAAGALADPASGSVINIMAIMSNSSVVLQGE